MFDTFPRCLQLDGFFVEVLGAIYRVDVDGVTQDVDLDENIYQVEVEAEHWFGRLEGLSITADDLQGEDERDAGVRILRRIDGPVANERALTGRNLRTISGREAAINPRRDLTTTFVFDLIVTSDNDPPIIYDEENNEVPDAIDINIDEGDLIELNYHAVDVEDEPAELNWAIADQPEGSDFTDNDDGSMTFTWQTDAFDFGDYAPVLTVTDTDGGTDEVTLRISVNDVPQPPYVVEGNELPDLVIDEDSEPFQVDFSEVFVDPEGEVMVFTTVEDIQELNMQIDQDNMILNIAPIANLNTHGRDPYTISIQATDPSDSFAVDAFDLTINDLNDPPDPFNLISPPNGFRVTDEIDEVQVSWEDATPADNPWEPDMVHYIFVIDAEALEDSVWIPFDQTSFTIDKQTVLDSIGYEGPPWNIQMALSWRVWALDDNLAIVLASNADFVLNLDLEVEDEYGPSIPYVYFLAPNYPNPFNAETTVQFGLPKPGMTNISIWDMHGRKVTDLASGYCYAGRYSVNWNADNVTSGVYIIRLQSGNFTTMRKAILLR